MESKSTYTTDSITRVYITFTDITKIQNGGGIPIQKLGQVNK